MNSDGAARKRQGGQALVEFAVGSIILIILLTGLLDVSRAYHTAIGLQGAARAGARHGAYFSATGSQNQYLDDTDIKSAVDAVLAGDQLPNSVLKTGCIAGTDSNSWLNPPYANSAYPAGSNQPWLYICYDTQGTKVTSVTTPPAAGATTYTGKDLLVVILSRYGLIGGLSTEYLKSGGSLTNIALTAFQHFAVQG